MKFSTKKGFTLIELLVVISIIGVLSTIVLSSLGEARNKSSYQGFRSEMRQMQTQAEISIFEVGGVYSQTDDGGDTVCPTTFSNTPTNIFEEEEFFNKLQDLATKYGISDISDDTYIGCYRSPSAYAFAIQIPQFNNQVPNPFGNDLAVCIDSSGNHNWYFGGAGDSQVTCPDEGVEI